MNEHIETTEAEAEAEAEAEEVRHKDKKMKIEEEKAAEVDVIEIDNDAVVPDEGGILHQFASPAMHFLYELFVIVDKKAVIYYDPEKNAIMMDAGVTSREVEMLQEKNLIGMRHPFVGQDNEDYVKTLGNLTMRIEDEWKNPGTGPCRLAQTITASKWSSEVFCYALYVAVLYKCNPKLLTFADVALLQQFDRIQGAKFFYDLDALSCMKVSRKWSENLKKVYKFFRGNMEE